MSEPSPVRLRGVLPVLQTPYHADESIDWAALEREIDFVLAQEADGVVVAMVSEVLRLSGDERLELTRFVAKRVARGKSTVISVGAESTKQAVALAQHAEGCGATAVMATPPVSTAALDDELAGYYRRILQSVRIPVIVQDASGYVGRPLGIDFQARLCDEFGPERVCFKPEAPPLVENLAALSRATGGRVRVFEGSGGAALADCFPLGLAGTMPGSEMVGAIVALWRALAAGDARTVGLVAPLVRELVALQTGLDGFLAVEKHLLVRQGVFANAIVRGPVGFRLDDAARGRVDDLFDRLQQAVISSARLAS